MGRRRKKSELEIAKGSIYIVDDPLLNSEDAAKESGRAKSTFWEDVREGRLPKPVYIRPRAPRWRRSWIRSTIEELHKEQTSKYPE